MNSNRFVDFVKGNMYYAGTPTERQSTDPPYLQGRPFDVDALLRLTQDEIATIEHLSQAQWPQSQIHWGSGMSEVHTPPAIVDYQDLDPFSDPFSETRPSTGPNSGLNGWMLPSVEEILPSAVTSTLHILPERPSHSYQGYSTYSQRPPPPYITKEAHKNVRGTSTTFTKRHPVFTLPSPSNRAGGAVRTPGAWAKESTGIVSSSLPEATVLIASDAALPLRESRRPSFKPGFKEFRGQNHLLPEVSGSGSQESNNKSRYHLRSRSISVTEAPLNVTRVSKESPTKTTGKKRQRNSSKNVPSVVSKALNESKTVLFNITPLHKTNSKCVRTWQLDSSDQDLDASDSDDHGLQKRQRTRTQKSRLEHQLLAWGFQIGENYNCPCGKTFRRRWDAKRHWVSAWVHKLERIHDSEEGNIDLLRCKNCGEYLSREDSLKRHLPKCGLRRKRSSRYQIDAAPPSPGNGHHDKS